MKSFEIPAFYRSPIISKVKAIRKEQDPRKKDFTPTILDFGSIQFNIARHFGFCYGVENAIEKAYKAIAENPDKRIFLLSQMIHNPGVNEDLLSHGVQFLQDTSGKQLIPFSSLNPDDVVIIPAFGASVAVFQALNEVGVNIEKYDTTCPFVEKVWNRSEKLGEDKHTIIIHGKYNHEETRATFSHSQQNAPSLVVKDMDEARVLGDYILERIPESTFQVVFKGKYSEGFDPALHLSKVGVVNQTTMLATETQEITNFLRDVMSQKFGEEHLKEHIADTRDTLCYATNDNQSATLGLMEVPSDFAIVVGGYNSSNTTHLVELLEQAFPSYFIKDHEEIVSHSHLNTFDIHLNEVKEVEFQLRKEKPIIAITSGASCPDAVIDRVIQRLLDLKGETKTIEQILNK